MNFNELFTLAKIVIYVLAMYEVGLLANLYFLAGREMTKSKVMMSLFYFLVSVVFFIAYRLVFSYSVFITSEIHALMRDLAVVPPLFIILTARNFRRKTLDKSGIKHIITGDIKDEE